MNRGLHGSWITALGLIGILLPSLVSAQNNSQNFDLKVELDKSTVRAGEEFGGTIVLTTRLAGAQGWSFGVEHDPTLLEILSATSDGSDIPASVFTGGFAKTGLVVRNNATVGFFQGVVMSLMEDVTLPVTPRFVLAKARYRVRQNVCDGRNDEISTQIKFNPTFSATPGGPEIGVTVTLNGRSIEPGVQQVADQKISCIQAPANLRIAMGLPVDRKLFADRVDSLDVNVMLSNQGAAPGNAVDVQGWSYSIRVDHNLLEVVSLTSGAATSAVNGGQGPDFRSYNIQDRNVGGSIRGVTAGVAISLDPPFEIIPLPAGGQTRHLETLRIKSAVVIPTGNPERTTEMQFVSEVLGENRPTELLVVVNGQGLVPDFTTRQTITLAPGALEVGRFVRADANDDRRVDIADGIWIINFLFYGGPVTACEGSADSNDDNRVDLSDAVFVFNWQLQPGIRPGDQPFRQPPAPFGFDYALACGIDPDLTPARCPRGSTQCDR